MEHKDKCYPFIQLVISRKTSKGYKLRSVYARGKNATVQCSLHAIYSGAWIKRSSMKNLSRGGEF